MAIMSDLHYEIDSYIVENGYCSADNANKMRLVETGMKKFMLDKIGEIDAKKSISNGIIEEISLHELAEILGETFPPEKRNETMSHLTRYIIGVAGFMQGYFIKWDINDDLEYLSSPLAVHNQDGKWDRLITHKQTPYIQIFDLALENLEQVMKLKEKKDRELVKSMRQAS